MERLLERVTCWLIQTANEGHLYQASGLPHSGRVSNRSSELPSFQEVVLECLSSQMLESLALIIHKPCLQHSPSLAVEPIEDFA